MGSKVETVKKKRVVKTKRPHIERVDWVFDLSGEERENEGLRL